MDVSQRANYQLGYVEWEVDSVEEQARVAELVLDVCVRNPICEAKNVVHNEDSRHFIDDLLIVVLLLLVWLYKSDKNHLEDWLHHKDEELNDEYVTEHHNSCCKYNSSEVVVSDNLD